MLPARSGNGEIAGTSTTERHANRRQTVGQDMSVQILDDVAVPVRSGSELLDGSRLIGSRKILAHEGKAIDHN